jgi:hypothetical protein
MATGDITTTSVGVFSTAAALITGMAGANCGGATAGAETATFWCVPVGNGQFQVFKIARAA